MPLDVLELLHSGRFGAVDSLPCTTSTTENCWFVADESMHVKYAKPWKWVCLQQLKACLAAGAERQQQQSSLTVSHSKEEKTSLANLRWPTRPQPIGSHYFQAWCLLYWVFYVSIVARFCFRTDRWTDRRTDRHTDIRTPRVKIMTTYSAVAWWVKKQEDLSGAQ